ncbi:MAG: hypothetical protein KGH75_02670 [Rhodospirillales bacterium]|nr:hypothetical protein [Rhodospirillales bacterium]
MATLTSANSSFALAVTGVFPAPVFLQGYAADDAFSAEEFTMAETVMGIDGGMNAGFVFEAVPMTITLMPTSPSLAVFDAWVQAQLANRDIFYGQATIIMPGIARKYSLRRGVLQKAKPLPDNKRTLQPVTYRLLWERVTGEVA